MFDLLLECILTPSRDLAYMEGAAPINPTCVQLLHHLFPRELQNQNQLAQFVLCVSEGAIFPNEGLPNP
jgi:hypothetical protein